MSTTNEPEVDGDEQHVNEVTNWEFLDRVPTRSDVETLLATLPPVWGVRAADYLEFVQPLPQKKKVRKPNPRGGPEIVDSVEAFTLYVSVAGRIKMLEEAQRDNGWRVDVVPEPVTPTGVPGYISLEQRIVYRVAVFVYERDVDAFGSERLLGVRHGTAWVPQSGGSNAAGTNPYEKVETSALGRAIAAWGFGVLPGSGIASVEEMAEIRTNGAAMRAEQASRRGNGSGGGRQSNRVSRDDLLQEALGLMEQVRLATGKDVDLMTRQVGDYLGGRLGVSQPWADPQDPAQGVNWGAVKDGQLQILSNSFRETLRRVSAEQNPLEG